MLAITVAAPYAGLESFLPKAAQEVSEETEIDGFRKGKAPYEVVRQKIGEFKLLEEAARLYIEQNLAKIIEEVRTKEFEGQSFEPALTPQVAITKLAPGEELEYKITLALLPPIELPDYRTISKEVLVTKKISEVSAKEIESSLRWLCESRAKLVTVTRGAKNGDRVEIDFSALSGDMKIEGGQSHDHPFVLGQGRFLPGFEDQLIAMTAGEEKEFRVNVPADWREPAIAGKVLEFKAKMKLVQEREIPAGNDEFAKSLGNFTTIKEVEENVRDGLKMEKEVEERERLRIAMASAIADKTRIELPEALIERELEKMTSELEESARRMGLKFEDYLGHIKKTSQSLKQEWRPDATRRLKIALVLREIAKREGIQPSNEEVQEAVNRANEHRLMSEEGLRTIDRQAFSDYHRGVARNEKVFQFLENLG